MGPTPKSVAKYRTVSKAIGEWRVHSCHHGREDSNVSGERRRRIEEGRGTTWGREERSDRRQEWHLSFLASSVCRFTGCRELIPTDHRVVCIFCVPSPLLSSLFSLLSFLSGCVHVRRVCRVQKVLFCFVFRIIYFFVFFFDFSCSILQMIAPNRDRFSLLYFMDVAK